MDTPEYPREETADGASDSGAGGSIRHQTLQAARAGGPGRGVRCLGAIIPLIAEGSAEESILGIVFTLLAVSGVYAWCFFDSVEQKYRIPVYLRFLIILLCAIGLPLYFIKTRGVRGLISSALALLFFALLSAIATGTEFLVDWIWNGSSEDLW